LSRPSTSLFSAGARCAGIALILVLAACTTIRPTDAAFSFVEVVDWYDEPQEQLFWPPSETVLGQITTRVDGVPITRDYTVREARENYERQGTAGRSHFLRLKVRFTTDENLAALGREVGVWNNYAAFYFCDQIEDERKVGFSGIVWQGYAVSPTDAAADALAKASRPITYYAYANVQGRGAANWQYDMRVDSKDVCMRTQITKWSGYRSNIVVIPKAAIAAALRNLPPYFRQ
ncbi:MAG: hypothetical protein VW600_08930, partial [Ferrovibrio sp.]